MLIVSGTMPAATAAALPPLDPANREIHSRDYQGKERFFFAFAFGEHYIWGATAGMLVNLVEVLTGE